MMHRFDYISPVIEAARAGQRGTVEKCLSMNPDCVFSHNAKNETALSVASTSEIRDLLQAFMDSRRVEIAQQEAARLEAARLEAERLEAERLEAERLEAIRREAERLEAERRRKEAEVKAAREKKAAEDAAAAAAQIAAREKKAAELAQKVAEEKAAAELVRLQKERQDKLSCGDEDTAQVAPDLQAADAIAQIEAERTRLLAEIEALAAAARKEELAAAQAEQDSANARLQIDSDTPLNQWSSSTIQWWLSSKDRLKQCLPALADYDGQDLCDARAHKTFPPELANVTITRLLAEMAAVEARLVTAAPKSVDMDGPPPPLVLSPSNTALRRADAWRQKWPDAATYLPDEILNHFTLVDVLKESGADSRPRVLLVQRAAVPQAQHVLKLHETDDEFQCELNAFIDLNHTELNSHRPRVAALEKSFPDKFGLLFPVGQAVYLEGNHTPWHEFKSIISNAFDSLRFLHTHHYVLMDFKAHQLIRMRVTNHIQMIDFDQARRFQVRDERISRSCTEIYAAPEVLHAIAEAERTGDDSRLPLAASSMDLWAFAMFVYEVATGQPFFATADEARSILVDLHSKQQHDASDDYCLLDMPEFKENFDRITPGLNKGDRTMGLLRKLLRPAARRASFKELLGDSLLSDSTSTSEKSAIIALHERQATTNPQHALLETLVVQVGAINGKLNVMDTRLQEIQKDVPQKFHSFLQYVVQAMREMHDRILPSLCVLLPVPDHERTWAQWAAQAIGNKAYQVHFLCEYDPRHHCRAIDLASPLEVAACESGKHLTEHAGYQFTVQRISQRLLFFLQAAHSLLTFVKGPARLVRILGLNVDDLIGDVASVIADTCQKALNCADLMQYVKPFSDSVSANFHAAASSSSVSATVADAEQKAKEALSEEIGNFLSERQHPEMPVPSAAAGAEERKLDGTSLVKLRAEIDPEQECHNVSENGIAHLFPTTVRDVRSDTMKVYFYCREHRDLVERHTKVAPVALAASASADEVQAADELERDVWFTQGLNVSRAAAAQCQIEAVLELRAENLRALTAAEAERRRVASAAANLAACVAAERSMLERLQAAAAAEAARAPNAAALRAEAVRAQNVAALHQRELVYHMVKSIDGRQWVIDGVPLRPSADKAAVKSGHCTQCGDEYGFFGSVVTCKVCGEFRCKHCAPIVEPRPRLNSWAVVNGATVKKADEAIELRACKPRKGAMPSCWARACAASFEVLPQPKK